MSLGSFIIQACSTCGNYTLQRNVGSENTSRSGVWTDGRRKGPNLPGLTWLLLVKCCHSSDHASRYPVTVLRATPRACAALETFFPHFS
jgi:hypothetical protein